MPTDFGVLLRLLAGSEAPGARAVVLYVLVAQLLAEAAHEGPPHPARHPVRRSPRAAGRKPRHQSLTGRRPRG